MKPFPRPFLLAFLALSVLGGSGCESNSKSTGGFEALSANMSDGDVWALNRPIRIFFNHPVDMGSVSFSSVMIRPTSSEILGRPVSGTFQLSETDPSELLFFPRCPIVENNFYPGLFPGGYQYELALPIESGSGTSVLRDTSGKVLEIGLARFFVTPTPPSEPLFIDTKIGRPPQIVSAYWLDSSQFAETGLPHPTRLNMFSTAREALFIQFDQAVDGNPTNLNITNLSLGISDDTITNEAVNPTFSATVPGVLTLLSNCDGGGALVRFQPSGVLPPDRFLRLTVSTNFTDLSGETNSSPQSPDVDFRLPTLRQVYELSADFPAGDPTADAFTEDFSSVLHLDLEAPLGLPLANVDTSGAIASFDYPGDQVSGLNLVVTSGTYLEVDTNGTGTFSLGGSIFTIKDGILEVNNFTLLAGSTFRGTGSNPLVIRANGTVTLDGTLDVSGRHADPPLRLNSPHLPEFGAAGECGGGDGGDASLLTNAETLRGEAGDGPFGLYPFQGGGGGESGFQQGLNNPLTGPGGELPVDPTLEHWVAAGGGGGGFGLGPNESVIWQPAEFKAGWSETSGEWPATFDNDGPDHRPGWHTAFVTDPSLLPSGAEPGLRGSSWDSGLAAGAALLGDPVGVYGMEDLTQDDTQDDNGLGGGHGFDPAFTDELNPPIFDVGHPSAGPDPGAAGSSPFTDGDTTNDFYGRRFNPSNGGSLIEGEMVAPWAGSGGGAGGDLQWLALANNGDPDMPMWLDLSTMWPDPLFPNGLATIDYFKGAPGGGGGGQLQIQAVGPIILQANCFLKANGGMGNGGENIQTMGTQVSGSGGGSGGHIILQSATGLAMADIELGAPGAGETIADMPEADIIQAIGGRRGWAMSQLNPDATVAGGANALRNDWDGNSQFMVGRGGAGGNGVIQIHVPRPGVNISFDSDWNPLIQSFIVDGNGDIELDNLEVVLDRYTAPASVCLIPFFSGESAFQSGWVDLGILGLRDPDGLGGWPKFGESILKFKGTDQEDASNTAGLVNTTNGLLNPGAVLLTGTLGVSGSTSGHSFILPGAESALASQFANNPSLLEGYDLEIDDGFNDPVAFGIADAQLVSGTLTLSTHVVDGVPPSSGTWSLREKFFRISTSAGSPNTGKDRLPDTATVLIEFQGAPEGATPHQPNEGAASPWTTELSERPGGLSGLEGMRFLRYRVTFNISANSASLTLGSERPKLEELKIPFAW